MRDVDQKMGPLGRARLERLSSVSQGKVVGDIVVVVGVGVVVMREPGEVVGVGVLTDV